MNQVGGDEGGCLVVALEDALSQILLDLHTKEIASELLLELGRVRGVELDGEAKKRVRQRQFQLPVHRLFQVQPVLDFLRSGVLEPKIVRFQEAHLLAHLVKQDAAQSFSLRKKTKGKK